MESSISFYLVTDVADVHYNFQSEKKIPSYPFHVSFAGETFNFFRDVCKSQSVVNLDCDLSLVTNIADAHYNF